MKRRKFFNFERNVVRNGGISMIYQIGNSEYFVQRHWPVIQSNRGTLVIDAKYENHSFCEYLEM